MPVQLDSLIDQELLQFCRLLPSEKRLWKFASSGWGCATALLVAGIVVFMGYLVVRGSFRNSAYWCFLAPAGLALAAVLWIALHLIVERRRKPYWRELQRRYAGLQLKIYTEQLESDVAAGRYDDADMMIIVAGRALPHGGDWVTRVKLLAESHGIVEVRQLRQPFLKEGEADAPQIGSGKVELSPQECAQIRELAAAQTVVPGFLSSTVRDGAPAEVAIWKRGQPVVRVGGCNLAGVSPRHEEHPLVKLMRLTERLTQKVQIKPLVFGSCNFLTGDVRIEGV